MSSHCKFSTLFYPLRFRKKCFCLFCLNMVRVWLFDAGCGSHRIYVTGAAVGASCSWPDVICSLKMWLKLDEFIVLKPFEEHFKIASLSAFRNSVVFLAYFSFLRDEVRFWKHHVVYVCQFYKPVDRALCHSRPPELYTSYSYDNINNNGTFEVGFTQAPHNMEARNGVL